MVKLAGYTITASYSSNLYNRTKIRKAAEISIIYYRGVNRGYIWTLSGYIYIKKVDIKGRKRNRKWSLYSNYYFKGILLSRSIILERDFLLKKEGKRVIRYILITRAKNLLSINFISTRAREVAKDFKSFKIFKIFGILVNNYDFFARYLAKTSLL